MSMSKWFRMVVLVIISLPLLWNAIAIGLVFSPEPTFAEANGGSSSNPVTHLAPKSCRESSGIRCLRMRDGVMLSARYIETKGGTTIVLVHGVLSDSRELEPTARRLHAVTGATIINLDLRGHGESEGVAGDTSYIGQYEDDLADVVAAIRKASPEERVILSGHSMGGGIVMRYAARQDFPAADAYLLFAPHLGDGSPTMRTAPTHPADPTPAFLQVHVRRTIGLVMLNALEIRFFNDKATLFFNTPSEAPIHHYSFRAMVGMSPDNYVRSLSADARPLLVLVGRDDEAFVAEQFPSVIGLHQGGQVSIIEHETHDSILRSEQAMEIVRQWIQR